MKKILFPVILITLFLSQSLYAQSDKRIELESNFFTGMKYYQNGQKITPTRASEIIKSNPTASALLKSSNKQAGGATVVSAIGGVLIGFPLGTAIGGGNPNWAIAGAGAAIVVVSAVIYSSAAKKAENAVEIYNSGLASSLNKSSKTEVRLLATPTQVGLSVSF